MTSHPIPRERLPRRRTRHHLSQEEALSAPRHPGRQFRVPAILDEDQEGEQPSERTDPAHRRRSSRKLASGEITSVELTQAHLDRIAATDGAPERQPSRRQEWPQRLPAHQRRRSTRHRSSSGCRPRSRQGTAPLARHPSSRTSSSPRASHHRSIARMLEGWMSPYHVPSPARSAKHACLSSARPTRRIRNKLLQRAPAFGVVRNPWALRPRHRRRPAVAPQQPSPPSRHPSLGTDTGGSIRRPPHWDR